MQSAKVFWLEVDSTPLDYGNHNKAVNPKKAKVEPNYLQNSPSSIAESHKSTKMYESCKEKACFGLPEECVAQHNCDLLLLSKYSQTGDGSVDFELIGNPKGKKAFSTKVPGALCFSQTPLHSCICIFC